jgi:DNA modification methylase
MEVQVEYGYKMKFIVGDSTQVLKDFDADSIDACITDPPYGMGMDVWDHNVPPVELWEQVYRVLKPGAFCLSFCSPELYHRMTVAVEDAGFDIRDQIMWMTTTKMPKANRLKPAHEPIVVAQKPYEKSVKFNMEKYGVGAIDTESTRVPWDKEPPKGWVANGAARRTFGRDGKTTGTQKEFGTVDANPNGRYPSNIIGEVGEAEQKYFYAPRATRKEKGDFNDHPTVKPVALMEYLIRIYCPQGNTILDPFLGSGSTAVAAQNLNKDCIGIDLSEHYIDISNQRISLTIDA